MQIVAEREKFVGAIYRKWETSAPLPFPVPPALVAEVCQQNAAMARKVRLRNGFAPVWSRYWPMKTWTRLGTCHQILGPAYTQTVPVLSGQYQEYPVLTRLEVQHTISNNNSSELSNFLIYFETNFQIEVHLVRSGY